MGSEGRFGIFDVRDNCWLGDDNGSLTYDDVMLAKAAATIMTKRMGRLVQARLYDPSPKKYKDTVKPKMSAVEAIKRIEQGEI